jgi:hypothetical protein
MLEGKAKLVRNISRRLERLEARVRSTSDSFSVMIHFVHPEKGVTSTLLMESGKQVWTNVEERMRECQPTANTSIANDGTC